MARQSSKKEPELVEALEESDDLEVSDASGISDDADEDIAEEDALDEEFDEVDGSQTRSTQADAMWTEVLIEPVELALPKGVGYTLRAYRLSTELIPTEVEEEEDDFAILRRPEETPEDEVIFLENAELFEEEPEVVEPAPKGRAAKKAAAAAAAAKDVDASAEVDAPSAEVDASSDEVDASSAEDDGASDEDEASSDEDEADGADVLASEEDDEEAVEPEEVPAFLGHKGKLLLFRSVEGLVEFVKSDEEHDMRQLSTWSSLQDRITVSAVVPKDDDRYELDLVVENLRGGQDAWDGELLIAAGEVARDLAYALRLEAVRTALSPGSPLDDLDEALRGSAEGGVGGFFARRRLKKIGAQQAALGWRTIIGKISAAVDWRD